MIVRTLGAVQAVIVMFLCLGLLAAIAWWGQTEIRCYCTERESYIGDGFQQEMISYDECLTHPACQPKPAIYYWKRNSRFIPYGIFIIASIATTVFYFMMKNWARIMSQAFFVFVSGIYVVRYFKSMPFNWGIPWKLIGVTCALIVYTGFMILFLNRSEVKGLFHK